MAATDPNQPMGFFRFGVNLLARLDLNFVLVAIMLLPACSWQTTPDTSELREAESALNRFLLRNGFTEAVHPDDLPVQRVSLWDGLITDEEIKKNRKASLNGRSFCVLQPVEYPYTFVFRTEESDIAVRIEADGTGWVHEANPTVTRGSCQKLPIGAANR